MIQAIPAPIIPAQYAPSVSTAIYTSPLGTTTIVDSITACNSTGGAITLTINIVPSGGSVSNANIFLNAYSIAGGATAKIIALDSAAQMDQFILSPNDSIYVLASAGSSVSIIGSGRQCS